jgi:hypothetical protein
MAAVRLIPFLSMPFPSFFNMMYYTYKAGVSQFIPPPVSGLPREELTNIFPACIIILFG